MPRPHIAAAPFVCRTFAAQRLEEYQRLCLPLLPSDILGGAAFDAVRLLASCMPGSLGVKALSLAASLRLVQVGDGTHPNRL